MELLHIESLRARAVDVPIAPLRTASGTITSCPLVLLDVATRQGVIGRSYIFTYTRACLRPLAELIRNLEVLVVGQPASPAHLAARLRGAFRLVGAGGLVAMALGGLDMALWDALARAAGLPLATLLGGAPGKLPAYWSVGLCDPTEARQAAEQAVAHGCRAMKIKLGHADLADDLAAIRAVREVGGPMQLMVDYNQSLTVPEAQRRIRRLEDQADQGLCWIEEPTRAEDFPGHAAIRRAAHTPIQLGENWSSPHELAASVAAGASDLAMLDAMKLGGVTGWLQAAALAHVHGLPVSSHIFPEISAHLLSVTPTAHWLEFLDLAAAVLQAPARVVDGCVAASTGPGSGVDWDEAAVARFAAD